MENMKNTDKDENENENENENEKHSSLSPPPTCRNENENQEEMEDYEPQNEPQKETRLPSLSITPSISLSQNDMSPPRTPKSKEKKEKEKENQGRKRKTPIQRVTKKNKMTKKKRKEDEKKKKEKKKKEETSWREERYMKTFVLPLEGSWILIKIENMKKRNLSKGLRPIQCTIDLIGFVRSVKAIKPQSIIIEAVYIDQGMRRIRTDELWFDRFGGKKRDSNSMWWVLSTPTEHLLKSEASSKALEDLKKKVMDNTIPEQIVDTLEEPIAFTRYERIPIDENLACQVCLNQDSVHPQNGEMLICDWCNDGCHSNCDLNQHGMQDRYYMCPKCKNKG